MIKSNERYNITYTEKDGLLYPDLLYLRSPTRTSADSGVCASGILKSIAKLSIRSFA